ncbi:MAG: ABC transporter permease [Deltaproteobacteria bacterium]|nr:MAG: ABC transporter permease [Deltaproteobacteria bacterium]
MGVGILLSTLARVCDLLPMALVGILINQIQGDTPGAMVFVLYGGAVCASFGGLALFQSTSDYLLSVMAQAVRHDIRINVFSHLLFTDTEYLESRRKGDLMSIITNDVDTLNTFFSETTANMVRVVISFAGTYGYLCWLDYRLALILMFPLPLAAIAMKLFSRTIRPQYLKTRQAVGRFSGILENSLQGIPVLQAYNAEPEEIERLEAASGLYRDTAVAAARTRRNFIPVIYIIAGLSFGLLIGGGGWLTQQPGGPSMGDYTTFILMGIRLVVPIFTLNFLINQIQQARAAITRIQELLSVKPRLKDLPDAVALNTEPRVLRFEEVSFQYPGAPALFSDVSLTIRKGDFIGIAGPTGAGKSSLIKLLLRFYAPNTGRVSINGHGLEAIAVSSFRQHVGYVSQHPYLFHGTIRENLMVGSPDADDAALNAAIEKAGLTEVIDTLPDGLDTLLGDQGNTLSGGQKQRLSLARALLRNPDVLILDEATSSVDSVTESIIQRNILELRQDRIIISIAHRLSTLVDCDRIFVMDRGGIVQEGTHPELVRENGVYRSLWLALQASSSAAG